MGPTTGSLDRGGLIRDPTGTVRSLSRTTGSCDLSPYTPTRLPGTQRLLLSRPPVGVEYTPLSEERSTHPRRKTC